MTSNRLGSLDRLRGLAALTVVQYHVVQTLDFGTFTKSNSAVYFFERLILLPSKFGEAAVYLFMALSGYVLTLAFVNQPKLKYGYWLFWRGIRLLPMYYATLILGLLVELYLGAKRIDTQIYFNHKYFFSDSTIYSGPNPPLWSLTVEILLSITFLILYKSSLAIKSRPWIYLLLYFLTYFIDNWGLRSLARAVIFFCIGAIFQSIPPRIEFKRYQTVVVLITFLSLGFIDGEFMRRVETGLQIVAIPTILIVVLKSKKGIMQTSKLLLFIGKISFSVYAVHWPVLLVMEKIDTHGFFHFPFNKVGLVLITEGVVILVGALLYFCLERPTQILARKSLHSFGN